MPVRPWDRLAEKGTMDLWTALTVIVRRWYVVVPAIILAVLVALFATSRLAPVYTASGSVLFTSSSEVYVSPDNPDEPERVEQVNPFEGFSPSLQTTAALVGDRLSSDEVRELFQDEKLEDEYEVFAPYDPTRTILAPSLEFDVENSDPDVAVDTVTRLQEESATQLALLQTEAKVRPELFIQVRPLITPLEATQQNALKVRVAGIVLLLGVTIALSLAFVVESLTSARATRRAAEERAERRITPDNDSRRARPSSRSGSSSGRGTRPVSSR